MKELNALEREDKRNEDYYKFMIKELIKDIDDFLMDKSASLIMIFRRKKDETNKK